MLGAPWFLALRSATFAPAQPPFTVTELLGLGVILGEKTNLTQEASSNLLHTSTRMRSTNPAYCKNRVPAWARARRGSPRSHTQLRIYGFTPRPPPSTLRTAHPVTPGTRIRKLSSYRLPPRAGWRTGGPIWISSRWYHPPCRLTLYHFAFALAFVRFVLCAFARLFLSTGGVGVCVQQAPSPAVVPG